MTIFSIGFCLALGIGVILALVASLGLLFIPFNERYLHYMDVLAEKRGLWTVWIVYGLTALGGLMIVMSVVFVTAALGRGVFRPFPWDQFISDYRRHGFWDATFTVLMLLTFYLWAFLIPAHAYATRREQNRSPPMVSLCNQHFGWAPIIDAPQSDLFRY